MTGDHISRSRPSMYWDELKDELADDVWGASM